jgi:TonB-linked outer membrane protein, SusC/RagA family
MRFILSVFGLILFSGTLMAQNIRVTGKVVDRNNDPLAGVYIIIDKTTTGTSTMPDGTYTISAPGNATLIFSQIGMTTVTIPVNNRSVINVSMEEDAIAFQDVVVVGYGTQRRANLTGSVATVDVSKTLESRPQADVAKALQGAVPGLTIMNSSGMLNAKPSITIRGAGTLSNDGVSNPLIVVDGVPMDDLSSLNNNDIESISVLKDAASSSIYGTRAAFGVILITTKSAKSTDRVSVNYSNNFSWDTPSMLPDFPDVATQARALRAANMRAGLANELFGMYMDDTFIGKANDWLQRHGGKRAGYREMIPGDDFDLNPANGQGQFYADWDVVGIMYRKWKPAQNHNINVQGGNGQTNYYMSFGYNNEEGVLSFNPNQLQRYNAAINVTTKVNDWLEVGGRVNYNERVYTEPFTRRYIYQYMWRWGSFFGPYGTYNGYDMNNSIAQLKQAGDEKTNNAYTRLSGFMKATLMRGLTLNADYTFSIHNMDLKSERLPVYALNSWGGDVRTPSYISARTSSSVRQESERNKSYAFNSYANYEFSLKESHNFNIMAGLNAEEGEYSRHWSQRMILLDSMLPEFSLATGDQTVGGSHSEWGVAGVFGRINYNYKDIWLLELNGRYDGSSKFPAADRWAFFPSGSVGYRFSDESYFDSVRNVINNGKLRISYGEIGNQAIGNNQFISTIARLSGDNTYWLDSGGVKVSAYDIPSLVSSTLRWERVQTLDFGLDIGLFKNMFNVTFDWYQRDTKDMLAPAKTMPQVLGALAPMVNAGTLRTKGWELNIDWHKTFGQVNLYANASITDYKTTVLKWENDSKLLNSNFSDKEYGAIWGFETERLFSADDFDAAGNYKSGVASQAGLNQGTFTFGPGDIKFRDLNGDGVIDGGQGTFDDHGDLKIIGNMFPRYQYGFRLGGTWKGFDLDMFFQGIGKRDSWQTGAFILPMARGADAIYAHQTDYWTEDNPNPNAFYPRMFPGNTSTGTISVLSGGNHNFYPQTRYMLNTAYLRFKNLTLGYTLPEKYLPTSYLKKLRVYFSANNICELINKSFVPIDPEVNTTEDGSFSNGTWGRVDPMYRTISFGMQISF